MLANVREDGCIVEKSIIKILNICYLGSNFKEETINSWLNHPVFDSNLWIWIIDEKIVKQG